MTKEATEILMEHDGALFKGIAFGWPTHVWNFDDNGWRGYVGPVPKGPDWGSILTPEEFETTRAEIASELDD